jgi:DNA-binding transcriptional ArsR family regulator
MLFNPTLLTQYHFMQTSQTETNLEIEILPLKKAAIVLRAVNHGLRQQIMQLLHKHERMDVTTLYVKLRLEQSVASQHLAILRKAGFVNAQRAGKQVFYSVNYARLADVTEHALAVIKVK